MNRLQYDMSVPFFKSGTKLVLNDGAVFVLNGRAVSVLNGRAVFVLNGRAVSLDSRGCQPLVGIPTMIRESRSDAIDSYGASRDTVSHPANTTNHTDNATAPSFPMLRGTMSRGLHPWLSNTIAPRFRTNTTHDPYRIAPRVKIKSFETKINI